MTEREEVEALKRMMPDDEFEAIAREEFFEQHEHLRTDAASAFKTIMDRARDKEAQRRAYEQACHEFNRSITPAHHRLWNWMCGWHWPYQFIFWLARWWAVLAISALALGVLAWREVR